MTLLSFAQYSAEILFDFSSFFALLFYFQLFQVSLARNQILIFLKNLQKNVPVYLITSSDHPLPRTPSPTNTPMYPTQCTPHTYPTPLRYPMYPTQRPPPPPPRTPTTMYPPIRTPPPHTKPLPHIPRRTPPTRNTRTPLPHTHKHTHTPTHPP